MALPPSLRLHILETLRKDLHQLDYIDLLCSLIANIGSLYSLALLPNRMFTDGLLAELNEHLVRLESRFLGRCLRGGSQLLQQSRQGFSSAGNCWLLPPLLLLLLLLHIRIFYLILIRQRSFNNSWKDLYRLYDALKRLNL